MITSIEIKRLRGIREGRLDDLTPLVVLVGPNGCGKSTVLDGLLIGASPNVADAVEAVVRRHQPLPQGLAWLVSGAEEGSAGVLAFASKREHRELGFWLERGTNTIELSVVHMSGTADEVAEANSLRRSHLAASTNETGDELQYSGDAEFPDGVPGLQLVVPGREVIAKPLHDLYSETTRHGLRRQVLDRLRALIPNLDSLEILTENSQPVLHLVYPDRSVPAVLAGDGILALLRVSLELASQPGGVVLVEEPEVHQHPGALLQTARAIWATVDRDVQVILTTHSLELIDFLVAEANEARIDKLSVYRLALNDGELVSSRNAGADVQFAREQIEYDLR